MQEVRVIFKISVISIKISKSSINFFAHVTLKVFLNVALWKQREYTNTQSYLIREFWLVLKLPKILYFYTNMSFKIPWNVLEVYYITFPSQGISLCFTILTTEKHHKRLLCTGFFVWFSGFSNSLLKCKEIYKLVANKFHLLKYKKLFKNGIFLRFELGKLFSEI